MTDPTLCASTSGLVSCQVEESEVDICIAAQWMCDGKQDCPNGFDELPSNCNKVKCGEGLFVCEG